MNRKVMIFGASGHAKVIADIIIKSKDVLVGFLDDGIEKGTKVLGYEVLGKCEDCVQYQDVEFIIGIGSNQIRKEIASKYKLKWYTAIHPQATIGMDVQIGQGSAIMAGTVINTGTKIGSFSIVNTSSSIDHECIIGNYVHVSVGSHLAGNVYVGDETLIGIGAVISNNICIVENCLIGAGAVVISNLYISGIYKGLPAKIDYQKKEV